jgi:hypothetical protein
MTVRRRTTGGCLAVDRAKKPTKVNRYALPSRMFADLFATNLSMSAMAHSASLRRLFAGAWGFERN